MTNINYSGYIMLTCRVVVNNKLEGIRNQVAVVLQYYTSICVMTVENQGNVSQDSWL